MLRILRRADEAVYRAERFLIVVLLSAMALAVFADALHRIFSAGEGRLDRLLVWLLPASLAAGVHDRIAPAVLGAVTFGVAFLAFRTVERAPGAAPRSRGSAALLALLVTAAAVAATQALVKGLPNGLVWSQQMALCMMLWVGFLGASVATRDRSHIALEVAGKIWPAPMRPAVQVTCRVVAASFCAFLAVLAVHFALYHFREWADSDGSAGSFEGFVVPRFVVYGFLPLPFSIMSLRFLAFGVTP